MSSQGASRLGVSPPSPSTRRGNGVLLTEMIAPAFPLARAREIDMGGDGLAENQSSAVMAGGQVGGGQDESDHESSCSSASSNS